MKRSPLRPISAKRRAEGDLRRELRVEQLNREPYCEANAEGCRHLASDVHEIVRRSQRPGAHLEPALFVSLCRPCHAWVTTHPVWAMHHGYALHQWEATDDNLEKARRLRHPSACRDKRCMDDHMRRLT